MPQTRPGGRHGFTFPVMLLLHMMITSTTRLTFWAEILLANLVDGVCGVLAKNGQVFNPYRAQSEPIYRSYTCNLPILKTNKGKQALSDIEPTGCSLSVPLIRLLLVSQLVELLSHLLPV